MTVTLTSRTVVLCAAIVVVCGTALAFAVQHIRRDAPADTRTATATPAAPASPARDQGQSVLAAAQKEASAVVGALSGSPPAPDSGDGGPTFDIARIEPSGDAVIAGRTAPGATVELLRNGEPHDRAVADQSGQFAMVPRPLPPGTYDLTLRSQGADGKPMTSKQSVAVALEANTKDRPVVALMTPDKPTVVLSQPAAQKRAAAAGAVVVEAVEIAPDGKFHVSGRANAGAAVRFYLNDSFVAPVTAGPDGRLAVTINEGVKPGNYRVRLDEVEPKSGTVRARAEVRFSAPDTAVTASAPPQTASKRTEIAAAQPPQLAGAAATSAPAPDGKSAPAVAAASPAPNGSSASAVVVPKIATTTVSRGDSLWRISQSTYGAGIRYAVIYKANQDQIRNPDLIYPGQIFVLPAQ